MVRWALCTVVALATLELGLRVFWMKQLFIRAGIEHPHFHHRLKAHETYRFKTSEFDVEIRTNTYGLRGPDPIIPKPPGVVRILMLGDSFTFGFPVKDEDTFSALIESGLRAAGYPVEVVNGGVSGYSPTLHYISLRDQYLAFEPDLVILWYDYGDLQEDYWFQKNLIVDGAGTIVRCDPRYTRGRFDWREWAKNHSALAKYVDVKLLRTVDKIRTLGLAGYLQTRLRGERAKVAIARLKREQEDADLPSFDRFLLVRETTPPALIERYFPMSGRYLVEIQGLLARRGVPLMLGLYPYGMTAGPDQWAEGRVSWGFEKGRVYDAGAFRQFIQQFAERERLPTLMTFEDFEREAAARKLYYDWDGHLTPEGHAVLAAHVLRNPAFLSRLGERVARLPRPADGVALASGAHGQGSVKSSQ